MTLSPTKILSTLTFSALTFGALALTAGAADAGITNQTATWCRNVGTADANILSSATATLVWKASGDLVLVPKNHFAPQIWSSGTAGTGKRLCFEASGDLTVYDAGNTKLWTKSDSTPPTVTHGDWTEWPYFLKNTLSLTDCELSVKYTLVGQTRAIPQPAPPYPIDQPPSYAGTRWTKGGICPIAAKSAIGNGWCITGAVGEQRILDNTWSELVWKPQDGRLVLRGKGSTAGESLWMANAYAPNGRVCFENTGRLSVFSASGAPLFQTDSGATTRGYELGLDDCRLTIRGLDGVGTRWDTAARCPQVQRRNNYEALVSSTAETVIMENDEAKLVYDKTGNLVLRGTDGAEYWSSGLHPGVGKRFAFQADGNLVVYNAQNQALWSSSTWGQGVSLLLLDGCSFSANATPDSQIIEKWSRGSKGCGQWGLSNSPAWSLTASGRSTILRAEESSLVWQHDGNLVLYTTSGQAVWSTHTFDRGKRLDFQADGNLVIYDASNTAIWSTGTWRNTSPVHNLKLGDRCTLTMAQNGATQWTGNTACRVLSYSFERKDGNDTFGAKLRTSLTAESGTNAHVQSSTGVDLKIFVAPREVFSATAYQSETQSGAGGETTTLSIMGDTTVALGVTYPRTFLHQTRTFTLGVVPVVVTAAATGELSLTLGFSGDTLKLTPSMGLYATIEAGVGAGSGFAEASVGIRGSLTLIELALPVSLRVFNQSNVDKYQVKVDLDLASLSGSLSLYAKARIEVWGVEVSASWSKDLFSWSGIDWQKNLLDKTGDF